MSFSREQKLLEHLPTVEPEVALAKLAFVVGGAQCVWNDLTHVRNLVAEPDIVVAVNDVGTVYPFPLDHWVSYHTSLLVKWVDKRRRNGFPDAKCLWTGAARPSNSDRNIKVFRESGGSSGYLGTRVALAHAEKVILVGVPLDPEMPHFNDSHSGKPWKDGKTYFDRWKDKAPELRGRVRSMSGMTRALLGEPTGMWLLQ